MATEKQNIASRSIFAGYYGEENQVTAAFLHLLERGKEPLLRYVLGVANELLPDNEIQIVTQSTLTHSDVGKSVFDGVISCNFGFTYIVESKIGNNPLTKGQVEKYHTAMPNVRILALTSDSRPPKSLQSGDVWLSWTHLVDALVAYEDENNDEVLKFLVEQFVLLLDALNLYDKWEERVIVVGGSFGEEVALKYGFYACQNNRYFKRAKYIAFAHKNKIRHLYEIMEEPVNDVDISKRPEIPKEYFDNYEPFFKNDLREYFRLKKVKDLKIDNDNFDKNGRRCAFVQRQTYTTKDKIEAAKFTSQL